MTDKGCIGCGQELPAGMFKHGGRVQSRCDYCYRKHNRIRQWLKVAQDPEGKEKNRQAARLRTQEYRREERRRACERKGKVYRTRAEMLAYNREQKHKRNKFDNRCLWPSNAVQAWGYWLHVKAPLSWLREYHKHAESSRLSRLGAAAIYAIRYKHQPAFNLKERMRRQVNKALKRDGIGDSMRLALCTGGKSPRVNKALGFTIAELKKHIELQFRGKMSWDRFRTGEIHIDHIIPQKSFDLTDEDEWLACWALTNLQPLWARDNLIKSASVTRLL